MDKYVRFTRWFLQAYRPSGTLTMKLSEVDTAYRTTTAFAVSGSDLPVHMGHGLFAGACKRGLREMLASGDTPGWASGDLDNLNSNDPRYAIAPVAVDLDGTLLNYEAERAYLLITSPDSLITAGKGEGHTGRIQKLLEFGPMMGRKIDQVLNRQSGEPEGTGLMSFKLLTMFEDTLDNSRARIVDVTTATTQVDITMDQLLEVHAAAEEEAWVADLRDLAMPREFKDILLRGFHEEAGDMEDALPNRTAAVALPPAGHNAVMALNTIYTYTSIDGSSSSTRLLAILLQYLSGEARQLLRIIKSHMLEWTRWLERFGSTSTE